MRATIAGHVLRCSLGREKGPPESRPAKSQSGGFLAIPAVVPLRTMFVSLAHYYLSIRNHQFSHPRFLQADLRRGAEARE